MSGQPKISIGGNLLLRDGRGCFQIGDDLWAPTVPTTAELGASFTGRELRLQQPLRALRRRVKAQGKAP